MQENDTVRVAVRIRPLNDYEIVQDSSFCITASPGENQVRKIEVFINLKPL
jgi:hypothetical protein